MYTSVEDGIISIFNNFDGKSVLSSDDIVSDDDTDWPHFYNMTSFDLFLNLIMMMMMMMTMMPMIMVMMMMMMALRQTSALMASSAHCLRRRWPRWSRSWSTSLR